MGLLKSMVPAVAFAVVAGSVASVRADEVVSACSEDSSNDAVQQLADAVNQASVASAGFSRAAKQLAVGSTNAYGQADGPKFAGSGSDQIPRHTMFDIKEAHESDGKAGIVPTVAWTDQEEQEIGGIEDKLPPCVRGMARIQNQYRVQRGLKSSASGILGAAYSYNNRGTDKGGQMFLTDLMFDKQVYKSLTGDEQMQAALGWRACFPPAGDPNSQGNVVQRVKAMPPEIKRITRDRILFHEFIHGVTHEQEGNDYANAASTEGFFAKASSMCPTCGASRFDELRAKLFAPGGSTPEAKVINGIKEQMGQIQANDPEARAKYCALYDQLGSYMKQQGVPQRWPGDMHALDDKDEYVTILIEQAVYDPQAVFGPASVYSPQEQQWVKNWWTSTFGPGSQLGSCSNAVASKNTNAEKSAVANAYSDPQVAAAVGYFGGF